MCVSLWAHIHRSKYGQGTLEGNRFKTHHNGTLEIKRIRIEDQGTYLCVVSNIAGRDESQVQIEVKGKVTSSHQFTQMLFKCKSTLFYLLFFSEPILIVTRPANMKVIRGTDVRFECGVKADVTTSLTTLWMKGKKAVPLGWRCIVLQMNLTEVHYTYKHLDVKLNVVVCVSQNRSG